MRSVTKKSAWATPIAIILALHTPQRSDAGLIVGNLDQSTATNATTVQFNFSYLAQEFNVGSQSYTLTSILATLGDNITPSTNVALLVKDSGGAPGTQVVANFTFPVVPGSAAPVEFDPTISGLTLAANTNYWFVLESTSGTGFYEWGTSNTTSLTAGSVGTLGSLDESFNNGSSWAAASHAQGLIRVDGISPTSVPEPSSLILMGLGGAIGLGAWLRKRRSGRRPTPRADG